MKIPEKNLAVILTSMPAKDKVKIYIQRKQAKQQTGERDIKKRREKKGENY